MPDQLTDEQTQEITSALGAGRKIQAIKVYRDATGKSLKDAKDAVEGLARELIEQDPERYKALSEPQGAGCASALVACAGLGAAVTLLVRAIA